MSFPAVSDRSAPSRRLAGGRRRYSFPEAKAYGYFIRVIVIARPQRPRQRSYLRALERKFWCSSAATSSAARPAPKKFFPDSNFLSARTSSRSCGRNHSRPHLPRHGLEILPLDGTFTPMPSAITVARERPRQNSPRDAATPASTPKPTTNSQSYASHVPLREADSQHVPPTPTRSTRAN